MFILIFFAFLAGLVTILSPCILPVLPIVLSSSSTGGKKRPIGIILGFIASFTFFTLFLSTLVKLTGISANALRYLAIAVIAFFGASLVIPALQRWVEILFSKLVTTKKNQPPTDGFGSGILIGLSLGLVWAPCVGPILAAVIALSFTGSITASAFFITLAYSLGTALPMLAIMYGGRNLLHRIPWLLSKTETIQKTFGIIMIATALGMTLNFDRQFQTFILERFPAYGTGLTKIEDFSIVQDALQAFQRQPIDEEKRGKPMNELVEETLGSAPELVASGQWFNLPNGKQTLTMQELRGKVVLVDFWTYTCINCIRTLPYIKSWWEKYNDKGLVIVGVHTPEFEFEKDATNVGKAIKDFGITYPVMQDNDYITWTLYDNHYWPAHYLIDKNGKIRHTHFGEGAYDETEEKIQQLLTETGQTIAMPINNPEYSVQTRTPETYLGYERIEYLASPEKIQPDKPVAFTAPQTLPLNTFAYQGTWTIGGQRAMPAKGSKLTLRFHAQRVFLVMRPKDPNKQGTVYARLDGKRLNMSNAGIDVNEDVGNGPIIVETDRLYDLIKLSTPAEHILELEFDDDNVELYAFTFG